MYFTVQQAIKSQKFFKGENVIAEEMEFIGKPNADVFENFGAHDKLAINDFGKSSLKDTKKKNH